MLCADADEENDNDLMRAYKAEKRKYSKAKATGKRSTKQQDDTLAMLSAFQSKLASVAQFTDYDDEAADNDDAEKDDDEELADDDMSWYIMMS